MKLIVGLGNPGKEYTYTRHNIGFQTITDFVDQELDIVWKFSNKWKWDCVESTLYDQKIIFLKPMEFMNRSWGSVSLLANFYNIEPKDILVIHDDIDLPVGKIQLKLWGSSAWHTGLKDIIAKIWSADFWRLRIGVDRPQHKEDVAEYVLHPFSKEDTLLLHNQQEIIISAITTFIQS